MDAAEADADVKLYKASAELLLELRAKIPRLVQQPNKATCRKWIIVSKTDEVTRLLDRFQEWPQLLDPYISNLIQVLADAYLSYCVSYSQEYTQEHDTNGQVSPLPRAIARILYAFCKVRGHKVILRLLNNEPKYIEPFVSCFYLWTSAADPGHGIGSSVMTWEERYIHLLWLSHLMLAPFELSTISGLAVHEQTADGSLNLYQNLPNIAVSLVKIGLSHLYVSSKAREAASTLLVRLAMRRDMQHLGFLNQLAQWTIRELQSEHRATISGDYRHIGLLSLLFGIISAAPFTESYQFLSAAFETAHQVATSSIKLYEAIRNSAPARKLTVKLMRSTVVSVLTADSSPRSINPDVAIGQMLEDCIQTLLDLLADKDTPVRQAASKALGLICLKLDQEMSAQVVEAVLDSFGENLQMEDVVNGKLFPATDLPKSDSTKYKKNVNAVNPLKWHGCMLTLGHFLFRRSLPTSQLRPVIEVLIMGLDFEQRSNVGTSVGVSVRDAACFGIWSLARKYSTNELNSASVDEDWVVNQSASSTNTAPSSTLQLIATNLSVSACLDPSGNLRRGSSAALQELIGRHPDAVNEGIPIVQVIDYHAVARRSRAMTEVAIAASELNDCYHGALMYSLIGWRGARSTDADSRRQAASAVGLLVLTAPKLNILAFLEELTSQLRQLKVSNTGSNATTRHGLLCCFASVIESLHRHETLKDDIDIFETLKPILSELNFLVGAIEGRVTVDLENVLEGIAKVIATAATFVKAHVKQDKNQPTRQWILQWASSMTQILDKCTVSSDKDFVAQAAADANIAVMNLLSVEDQIALLRTWLDPMQPNKAHFICKGRITTIGQAFTLPHKSSNLNGYEIEIVHYLHNLVKLSYPIETKMYAMQSIHSILSSNATIEEELLHILMATIHIGLADYTIDQRGDIGSLLRLESIEAAGRLAGGYRSGDQDQRTPELLVKLSAEKLTKVRFHAWQCFQHFLPNTDLETRRFVHQADVSSFEYFRNLMEYVQQPQYHEAILLGIVTTIIGGSEDVSRACSEALIEFLQDHTLNSDDPILNSIVNFATQYALNVADEEDREVLPAIDFISLLVEQYLGCEQTRYSKAWTTDMWNVCHKVHTNSSSIARMEAMVRLYLALTFLSSCRQAALDRLTRLLLHRWPKIRGAAADALIICTETQSLTHCDWNASAVENKPAVLRLRKDLDVAGVTATNLVSKPAVVA